jgi:hypothetical protein
MQTHGGKGSTQRPTANRKQFEDNWDRIFGKKKKESDILKQNEIEIVTKHLIETNKLNDDLNELNLLGEV